MYNVMLAAKGFDIIIMAGANQGIIVDTCVGRLADIDVWVFDTIIILRHGWVESLANPKKYCS